MLEPLAGADRSSAAFRELDRGLRSCEVFEFSIFRPPVIEHLRAEKSGFFENFTASYALG
jgi:hypothetical protein